MKKEASTYTVEREFLNKLSTQELISRIIKSHLTDTGPENSSQNNPKNL